MAFSHPPVSLHCPGTQIEDLHARVHMLMNIFVNAGLFMLMVLNVFVIYVRECGRVHAHVSSMINSKAQNLIGDQVLLKASAYIPLIQIHTYTYAYTAQFLFKIQCQSSSQPPQCHESRRGECQMRELRVVFATLEIQLVLTVLPHTHTHTHTTRLSHFFLDVDSAVFMTDCFPNGFLLTLA